MSFATFNNFIVDLASRPLPPQIDRMMLDRKSGTDQNNLLSTLTAFDLIDQSQSVQPKLEALAVEDKEDRQAELAKIVREYYPSAVDLSERHGTQQQLVDIFREELGLDSPDTRRKAITFFLHAVTEAGLPMSAHFKKTRSGSGSPGASRPRRRPSTPRSKNANNESNPRGTGGPTDLGSGRPTFDTEVQMKAGRVVLTVDVNPIELRGADRKFFFELLDKMDEYRDTHSDSPADSGAVPYESPEGGGL